MKNYYLIPGNNGKNCDGNGLHKTKNSISIKCRCEKCGYKACCAEGQCKKCKLENCPRKKALKQIRKNKTSKILKKISDVLGSLILKSALAPYPEAYIENFFRLISPSSRRFFTNLLIFYKNLKNIVIFYSSYAKIDTNGGVHIENSVYRRHP